MNKIDKLAGNIFKVMAVLYVVVIASKNLFRPDIYNMVSLPVEVCVEILLFYIVGRWMQKKIGLTSFRLGNIDKRMLLKLLAAIVGPYLLLSGAEYYVHDFSLTKKAIAFIQSSEDGVRVLGHPLRIGWFITYNIKLNSDTNTANLTIPIKGSKADGKLEVYGIKKNGAWRVIDLYLRVDGNKNAMQIPH